MATTWFLGTPIVKGKFTSTNAYSNVFLKSSPISVNYINILAGGTGRVGEVISPRDTSNNFQKFNIITGIIDNPNIDLTTVTLPTSMALQGLVALQNDATAQVALLPDDYFTINVNMFNQFAVPSTIVTTMLGYGNKEIINDNSPPINPVTTEDSDIAAIWPHQSSLAIILSITDIMTYIVKSYRTRANLIDVASQISEWRWLYPNRPRCVKPKSKYLLNSLNPTTNIANTTTYPSGAYMWDMLRYDFFETTIRNGLDTNNTLILNDPDYPMSNDVFDLRYDYLAAPGCLLLRLKVDILYDDGTGSRDKGLNTSRVILKTQSNNGAATFPTVFRIGLEFLEDFITSMNICRTVEGKDNVPTFIIPTRAGVDLEPTLRFLYRAFINCKRLYIWRLFDDIIRYRVNRSNPDSTTAGTVSPIAGGLVKGVYMCLLEGKTDYSNIEPNAVSLPNPSWENLYVQKYIGGVKDTLVVFTSVELGAYTSASFTNEGVVANKYGPIRVFTDLAGFPQRSFDQSYIDYTNSQANTISAEDCVINTNCLQPFLPTLIPTKTTVTPPRGTGVGNIFLYVILGIVIIILIALFLYFILRKPKVKKETISIAQPYVIPRPPPSVTVVQPVVTTPIVNPNYFINIPNERLDYEPNKTLVPIRSSSLI